jgi:hypothetical protein
MAAGYTEAIWGKLRTTLNQASLAAMAADADRGLAGAHPVFYVAEQTGARWLLPGANSLTGRSPWYAARRCRPDLPKRVSITSHAQGPLG